MVTNKLLIYFLLFTFFLLPSAVKAFQGKPVNYQGVTLINDPETIQTYFGELNGRSNILYFKQDQNFTLTLKVLTPVENPQKNIHLRVGYLSEGSSIGQNLVQLTGSSGDWGKYTAIINNQQYLQLPEYKYLAGAGEYTIEISSPDNYGEYGLIIGHKQTLSTNKDISSFKLITIKNILMVLTPPLIVLITISLIILRVVQTLKANTLLRRKTKPSDRNKPGS